MSDRMRPIPIDKLLDGIFSEYFSSGAVFGVSPPSGIRRAPCPCPAAARRFLWEAPPDPTPSSARTSWPHMWAAPAF